MRLVNIYPVFFQSWSLVGNGFVVVYSLCYLLNAPRDVRLAQFIF